MRSSIVRIACGVLAASVVASAVDTRTWVQSQASEFEKGTLKGLALSSSGRLTLAPVFKEIHDAALPQLWSAVAAGDGTLYTAGADGKVLSVDPRGQARVLTTLEGGAVYALALNAKGELFAATSPDAKIYRIARDGKATVFAEPKVRYIWALVFDASGTLYAAAGDPGQVLKFAADGAPSVLFDADEAHVRSLVADGKGNLVAGTEPSGLIIRVSPKGEGFVLYQTAKREVTALAVAKDGSIYAAASGVRSAVSRTPVTPTAPVTPVTQPAQQTQGGQPQQGQPGGAASQVRPITTAPPSFGGTPPATTGGSDVYRIALDGEPLRIWTDARALAYALALDASGTPVVGTGNEGRIYRIDSALESTQLAAAEPMQVTALATAPGGGLYAATANAGKIYRLGPEMEKEGSIESDVFDAGSFTYWGRMRFEGDTRGGSIALESRSGNLDRAQRNWSAWSPVDAAKGGRIQAPSARFLGWRATLKAAPNGQSPVLSLVEAAYQAKNVAPVIQEIEVTPANYRFPTASLTSTPSTSLSLPPIGQPRRSTPAPPTVEPAGAATLSYEKGQMGARWRASDANGDTLRYKIEIRGVENSEWFLVKDDVTENRVSFDTTRYADGRYRLRVTVTDKEDNYPGQALTAQAESDPFTIDNTAPRIEGLSATAAGGKVTLRFRGVDALSSLYTAVYSINGGEWIYARPTTGITDSLMHDYEVVFDKPSTRETVIAVRLTDENDNVTVEKTVLRQ